MAGRGEYAVRVSGVAEVLAALKATDRAAYRNFTAELRAIAGDVAKDAELLFDDKVPIGAQGDPPTATQFKPRTRTAGGLVYVEQARRKVTGKRPDYGAKQMRNALLPAAAKAQADIGPRVELAVAAAIFENGLGVGDDGMAFGGFA